jgi:hypothetical protein
MTIKLIAVEISNRGEPLITALEIPGENLGEIAREAARVTKTLVESSILRGDMKLVSLTLAAND